MVVDLRSPFRHLTYNSASSSKVRLEWVAAPISRFCDHLISSGCANVTSIKHNHHHHTTLETMTSIRISRSGETVLTPPRLPEYLSAIHELKPIVGKPEDEDVKVIHTVIRALNAVAHGVAYALRSRLIHTTVPTSVRCSIGYLSSHLLGYNTTRRPKHLRAPSLTFTYPRYAP
ncbi:hypothetical protein B0J17DRAFT_61156 [Rhizoctonia solani]|nr:hypothetical protein B0J17DRAFT_61156 [Rhizoctonia solani]